MKLVTLMLLAFTFAFTGCSSFKDKFNDVKLDIAKEGKEFVTKELKSEYADVVVEGVNCDSEAEAIGIKVEEKLISFLKAEQKDAAIKNKSLTSAVLPAVCSFVAGSIVPELISGIKTEYVCLKEVGADKMIEIGKDLCDQIK